MDKIKKRNGTYAAFDPAKIQTAIMKANVRVAEEPMTEEDLSFLTQRVVKKLEKENEIPDVEHIQDIVERTLSKAGYSRTAKAYILYRAEHAKMREMRDTLPEIFSNLTFKAASEVDMKRENANINTDTAMGTMLKFGTESAKDYFDKFILPPHIAQADHDGDIHIHDKDFYTITETCCQIDLLKLFKDGFSTGHGYLREPNSIRSYAALACIAIQANQNEMHGGQAVPNFDYAMADGVRKTYRKSFLKHLAETLENKGVWPVGTGYQELKKMDLNVPTLGQADEQKWPNVFDNKIHEALDTYGILVDEDYRHIARRAYTDTVDETHQAMEAVIHNLNSMHCYGENSSIWAYNHETEELNTVTIGKICETFKPKKWSVFAVNPRTGITELKYITAVQKVGNHRDMVTIKTKTGQKTRMTTNHRMITLDENANIVERYPDETTLALAPKGIKLPENHAPVHDLWKYCERCGKPYANSPKTARYISITPELAELFGYYVADGSTIGKQTAVTFTVCNKIKGEHLKHLMDKAFNADFTMYLTYYTAKTGKSEIKDYRFNTGTHIAKFFKDMCGENAASKKVPQDILQGSKNLFQVFYRAYIACDGHNAKTVSFSSVSKKLRDQINMLCMAYGELPAYNERVKYHPTKNTPCPKRYDANLNRTGAQRLGIDVINKPQVTLPKYNLTIATRILKNSGVKWGPTDCGRIPFRRTRQIHYDELQNVMAFHNKTFGLSHLLNLYPIDIIEKTYDNSGDENVYDITVEDYENFLTDECVFVHNSRAGAQVPFSSINYGTDTSPEGQLAIKEILNATEDGLGNGETPIFPVQIFKVKEGVNYNPDDPNYSLLKQAMRVSAKRLFPNFSFMDAPFNKQYLGKHPDKPWYDEVGYMGCVLCTEVLTYKVRNMLKVHSIGRAWNEFSKTHSVQKYGESEFIDLENDDVTVWDSHTKGFVKVKKWIKNPNKNNWFQLKLSSGRKLIATADHPLPTKERGRCFIKDLTLSDQIPITSTQYSPKTKITPDFNTDFAWLLGVLLCDSSYAQNIMISLGNDEKDIEQQITNVIKNIPDYKFSTYTIQQNRGYKGSYRDINIKCGTKLKPFKEWLTSFFGGRRKLDRQIPDEIFSWPDEYKYAFIAGMMDADGYIDSKGTSFLGSTNHELATQQMLLLQSVSIPAKCYINHYTKNKNATRLAINFTMTDGIIEHMQSRKKVKADEHYRGKPQVIKEFASIISIEALDIDQPSYDIETESDRFDVSGVLSHNCRTRVMANVYDPENEITPGRGNLSFTSINLPRIAIQSRNMVNEKGEFNSPTNMEKFYRILDERIDLCIEQLLHRFKIQCSKHVYNYPFLMGEGVWINSKKLSPADTLETVLKHGTLSVGFIGLAETLVALTGKHHGESEESWKLGYEIIKYMRERMDQACKKYKLNLSLLATPGEGLCVAGDTSVQTIDGCKPIKEIKTGDPVVTLNESTGRFEIDTVVAAGQTGIRDDIYEVEFTNGQKIVCTSNHPFAKRNMIRCDATGKILHGETIEWTQAQYLKEGDRIRSGYRTKSDGGYLRYKHGPKGCDYLHKMAYEYFTGQKVPNGMVVHHKDENKQHNSDLTNLELMTSKAHKIYHLKDTIGRYTYTSENQLGEKNSFFGKRHSEETKKQICKTKGVNYVSAEQLAREYTETTMTTAELAAKHDLHISTVCHKLRSQGIKIDHSRRHYPTKKNDPLTLQLVDEYYQGYSAKELAEKHELSYSLVYSRLKSVGVQFQRNHTVKTVRKLNISIPVYDITMSKNHNFLVGGEEGILVHNSGTFVRIDKKKYGIIPGVTNREYYTNSFHVPVYYNISAFDKIKKEAPFHELTNAGHISYVEVDGDIAKNLDAFEAIIRCMKESGIGYGSINHPVDRDPICGYVGIINEVCPRCGRRENEAVSLEKLEELKKKYRNMPDITKYIQ